MRPSERIHELEVKLRAARVLADDLAAHLRAQGIKPVKLEAWAGDLTRREVALIIALRQAHPWYLSAYQLDEVIPHYRPGERDPAGLRVMVFDVRKKLPAGAIETVHGRGWRLSDGFADALAAETSARP